MPKDSTKETEIKKRAPRRKPAKTTVASEVDKSVRTSTRKAPTKTSNSTPVTKKSKKALSIVSLFILAGFGFAIFIGNSDKGEINIAAVMTERNARFANQNPADQTEGSEVGANAQQVIPVQNRQPGKPMGGLVPSSPEDVASATKPPEPEPETASSSASSTDDVSASDIEETGSDDTEGSETDPIESAG